MRAFLPQAREFLKAFLNAQDDDMPLVVPNTIQAVVDLLPALARMRLATGQVDISVAGKNLFTTPTGKFRLVYVIERTNVTVGLVNFLFAVNTALGGTSLTTPKTALDILVMPTPLPMYQGDSLAYPVGNAADTVIGFNVLYREFPFSEATS